MTLSEVQQEFAQDIALLIARASNLGWGVTFGDAYRDPRVHGKQGEKKSYSGAKSAHKNRLAVDLNLFIDGVFQTTTEAHRRLGEYWKGLHPDNRWGGDFSKPDGNHYSREYRGIA